MKREHPYNRALLVLVAVNILNFYDRNILGALAEPIRKDFGLTDTQVGLLGTAFIWLYAIIGLPLGKIADTRSRRKLLAGGMVVWSALTAVAALASSYWMLLFSRLGFAIGEAAVAPAATSWIGDLFPPAQRSRPLALFMLGVPMGGAASYFFSGQIAQAFGWRAAMVIAAAPALLLVPLLLRLPEPVRSAAATHGKFAKPASIRAILKIPTIWWIIASGALLNFNMYAISTFLPAFLSRIHHLSLARSGMTTGIVYAAGGVAGGLGGGWIGDRIFHRRKDGRLLCAAAIAAIGAPMAYFGILEQDVYAAVVLIAVTYAALNSYYGLVYSSIQDIVPPGTVGTAMAIYFMAMYLCGASFGPLLTGKVSDLMARRAADAAGSVHITEALKAVGLQQAMLMLPVLSLLLAAVLYCGSRTIIEDMRRREAASQ
jgi:predicted MFS family arabinose efflux permease